MLDVQQNNFNLVSTLEILERLSTSFSSGYLMNRETLGIPLRKALVKQLHSLDSDTLVIDLAGVKEMTTSVAEEIGPLLFQELINYRRYHENVCLTYCNVSEEISRGLDGVFKILNHNDQIHTRRNIVVFSTFENGVFSGHQFLGEEIPTTLKEILDVIYRFNMISSSDLEDLGIKAASKKLNELAKLYSWLFRKTKTALDVDSRAWAYVYSPVVPVLES